MKSKLKKLKHNHSLMMVICCGVPLILLIVAVYLFGLSKNYLFWFILLLCPAMHYFMMKDMHKKRPNNKKSNIIKAKILNGGVKDDKRSSM